MVVRIERIERIEEDVGSTICIKDLAPESILLSSRDRMHGTSSFSSCSCSSRTLNNSTVVSEAKILTEGQRRNRGIEPHPAPVHPPRRERVDLETSRSAQL
jgi:hypothetical protein